MWSWVICQEVYCFNCLFLLRISITSNVLSSINNDNEQVHVLIAWYLADHVRFWRAVKSFAFTLGFTWSVFHEWKTKSRNEMKLALEDKSRGVLSKWNPVIQKSVTYPFTLYVCQVCVVHVHCCCDPTGVCSVVYAVCLCTVWFLLSDRCLLLFNETTRGGSLRRSLNPWPLVS